MKREERERILRILQEAYPKVFLERKYLPLKRKIDLDICDEGVISINRSMVRMFLKDYTSNFQYIKNHAVGAKRYDLKGNIVGEITEEEELNFRKYQEDRLKKIKLLKKLNQKNREGVQVMYKKRKVKESK